MYCTEALPGHQTDLVVSRLMSWDVPVTVIADSAVAFHMGKVDMVLVGAQGVVENGGILNKMGTLQIAIVARSYNKPLYVASESYKFARIFPLDQTDLTIPGAALDFTPPECVPLPRRAAPPHTSTHLHTPPHTSTHLYTPPRSTTHHHAPCSLQRSSTLRA